MDCEMPEKDGFTATEDIRRYEEHYQLTPVPIVALSAHALPEHVDRCMASGMNKHIAKPVSRQKLEGCFQTYFPMRSIA
jgi:CheY-like chemotaxis protein